MKMSTKSRENSCSVATMKPNQLYDYELTFTKLGVLKISDGKYGCFTPKNSPTLERSTRNQRQDSYDEEELVNAMEKFPDFLPAGFAVSISKNDQVLGSRPSQRSSLADRNVVEWIRKEYGMIAY